MANYARLRRRQQLLLPDFEAPCPYVLTAKAIPFDPMTEGDGLYVLLHLLLVYTTSVIE